MAPSLLPALLALLCFGAAAASEDNATDADPSSWWDADAEAPAPDGSVLLWAARQCDPMLTAFVWTGKPGEWASGERRNANGSGPLHLAAACPAKAVAALVFAGADLEEGDGRNRTALHLAAEAGKTDVMEVLLRAGASLEAQDCEGNRPLHFAARSRSQSVRFLLKHGADVKAKNLQGETPLHVAMEQQRQRGGLRQQDWGLAYASPHNTSLIYTDVNATHYSMHVTQKFSRVANVRRPSPVYSSPILPRKLHLFQDTLIPQMLMQAGSDVNAADNNGTTPLHCAATSGSLTDVQRIIMAGGNRAATDKFGRTPADLACLAGRFDNWKTIVGEQRAETCWHHKSKMGQYARRHFKCKDDPNTEGPGGKRGLHYAAEHNPGCIQELLKAGADPDALDWTASTPLLPCAANAHCDVDALLTVGADVNATDWSGRTALINAAERGLAGTVRKLLDAGAAVDVQDRFGDTALHCAARGPAWQFPEMLSVIEQLLQAGADRGARNRLGATPLQVATAEGTRKLLKEEPSS